MIRRIVILSSTWVFQRNLARWMWVCLGVTDKKYFQKVIFKSIVIKSSSSSSCRSGSTDIPDPLSPPLPTIHCFQGYIPNRHRAAGRPAFARPCEGVHKCISIMSSSLLLRQCPACLVRLILIVFVMGGRRPYSCCFVGCCLHDFFNIARSILA